MMEKILIFIAFLCPLIFFHELGHFLFARLFGVRVEIFSIGFGPNLFKFQWNHTKFTISLIPLGGYVKMFGDDPFNDKSVNEEDRRYAFNHKGKWARFWILFGGPLANFIFAYFIFFGILLTGEKVPEAKIGPIPETSLLAQKGFLLGDHIYSINGKKAGGLMDVDLTEEQLVDRITVERGGQQKEISVNLSFKQFLEEFFKYPPHLRRPLVVDKKGSFYGVSLQKGQINWEISLEEINQLASGNGPLYLYRLQSPYVKEGPIPSADFTKMGEFVIHGKGSLYTLLASKEFFPHDLLIDKVIDDSPASKAGLRHSDIIVSLEGQKLAGFDELRTNLQNAKVGRSVLLQYYRNEVLHSVNVHPESTEEEQKTVLRLGVFSSADFIPMTFIQTEGKNVIQSAAEALKRTWQGSVRILYELKRLIVHEVSFKNVGGPLAIGKVASDSLHVGISYFFKLMAIISINLGLINLFPIPVLDGGHIMFIALEAINGGPLSRKKMEWAQNVGLSLLFLLIFATLFNDLSRIFNF